MFSPKRRVFLAALAAGGLLGLGAPAAFAAPHSFASTEQVLSDGDVFAVNVQAYNAPVLGSAGNLGNAQWVQRFFNVNSHGQRIIGWEFAPGGFDSGLCLADIGPGYGSADQVNLRTCNGTIWQRFRELPQGNHYAALQNVGTNQYITDDGTGNALTSQADNRPCAVGIACPPGTFPVPNTFNGNPVQQWRDSGGFLSACRLHLQFGQSSSVLADPASDFSLAADGTITDSARIVSTASPVNPPVSPYTKLVQSGGLSESVTFTGSGAASTWTAAVDEIGTISAHQFGCGVRVTATGNGAGDTYSDSSVIPGVNFTPGGMFFVNHPFALVHGTYTEVVTAQDAAGATAELHLSLHVS